LNHFYIECRIRGDPKRYLKRLRTELAYRFRIRKGGKQSPPHITLYGPFKTSEYRGVFSRIEKVAKRYKVVPFSIDGFERRQGLNGKVIVGHINASSQLVNLRRELAEELNQIVKSEDCQPWDTKGNAWFHTTILQNVDQLKYDNIWHYLNRKKQPFYPQHLVRITVLNNRRRIECEYDLILERWLNRREALSKSVYQKTINKLIELLGRPPKRSQPTRIDLIKKIFIRLHPR
jgi:2'-5' RNA ligase